MVEFGGPLLQVRDLTTRFYTDAGVVNALNGVSLDLHAGETLGVVGESGSGKSTLALTLMGLISPPRGRIIGGQILYNGDDLIRVNRTRRRRLRGSEIAMVFQDPMVSLNPVFTIGNQVGEVLRRHLHLNTKAANERAVELLSLVGLSSPRQKLRAYPHQLSGGMRQRAMIAMALAANPKILIADEPTTALDVTIQAQIIELVRRLRDQFGMAMIWITHDLGVVAGLADRVIVMYAGHVVEEAQVRQIFKQPRHPYTLGLLNSLPRVDQLYGGKLVPIPGSPSDLIARPHGCPFAPRCTFRVERCTQAEPPLTAVERAHRAACFVDVRNKNAAGAR
jgi:oligopeptide/dipeptide ABC transporter ATP-binding protein